MCYYLFLTGHMEYAIIFFSVGEKIFSWLFHVFIFNFLRVTCLPDAGGEVAMEIIIAL